MGKALLQKLKEAALSVLPVTLLLFLLAGFTLIYLPAEDLVSFGVGAVLLIVGIAFFGFGAELSMTPMGEQVGFGLTKSKSPVLLLSVSFLLGALITVAEPDLSVLAGQVSSVLSGTVLIVTVGVGVGLFLLLAVLKILLKADLSPILIFCYFLLFAVCAVLSENGKGLFLPLSFDAGGVTTGPVTVPFIMALGVGVAGAVGGKKAGENSFGLIALCSIGPMLAVALLSLFSEGEMTYSLSPDLLGSADKAAAYLTSLFGVMKDVALAIGLIVLFFLVLQATVLKLPKRKLLQMGLGLTFTFTGLVLFLTAVNASFVPVGFSVGRQLANTPPLLVGVGCILGAVVVLAEPAVKVLNKQVEEVTGGAVKRRTMLISLSIGVGIAIGLSFLRVWLKFSLLYYVVIGYGVSLVLSFFVPKMYTAIAFDSGGVASGPLTSGFILPMAVGACETLCGAEGVLSFGFGVVAMVAMTPLITIQFLGFRAIAKEKVREEIAMRRILSKDDEQIISFM